MQDEVIPGLCAASEWPTGAARPALRRATVFGRIAAEMPRGTAERPNGRVWHRAKVEMRGSVPSALDAGADLILKVVVS